MTARVPAPAAAAPTGSDEVVTVARNVSTRYLAIGVEAILGLLILPFNVQHLGPAAYGLWMLAASVIAYFSILDLGYSGALLKFVAQYRARRDERGLNEILSTMFYVFTVVGLVTYLVAIGLALFVDRLFELEPGQVATGRAVILIVSLNVSIGTMFSVFGAVTNGFQRYDLNNLVGAVSSVLVAVVNVAVLLLGFGLIELVAAITATRLAALWIYRLNAYRVFPGLHLRPSLFRLERLREVTGFSIYILVIDWAHKLNYAVDALVIGAFLSTVAVAVWTVGQRLAEVTQRLANQLNEVLFPTFVDHDTAARAERVQQIFLQGTRLSLATVLPIAGALILMADRLVPAWVGPGFAGSVPIVQILAVVVVARIGAATSMTLLKSTGRHRLVAVTSLASAVCNIALSVLLVQRAGLVGVAAGTLVPISLAAMLVIFPAGCRHVRVSLPAALARAVWPALWPAAVMTLFVLSTKEFVAPSLIAIGGHMAAAGLVYLATFLFLGISADERRSYLAQLSALSARLRLQPVSEGA